MLFPGGTLPLRVFEARYVDMTSECLRHDRPFGACLIREGNEVGGPAVPEAVGCTARIVDCDAQQVGVLNLRSHGEQRFRILRSEATAQGLVVADVEYLPEQPDIELPEEYAPCAGLLRQLVAMHGPEIFAQPHCFESTAWVGYRLCEVLPLPMQAKQQLLEMDDGLARLAALSGILESRVPRTE